jgi:LacI family transcriptional regulator
MFELPKPITLSAQTTRALRKAIAAGTWRSNLPSERRLCALFQVSRPTIRTALQTLAKQGFIKIRPRRRHELLAGARRGGAANPVVVLVSREVLPDTNVTALGIGRMRAHLARNGFSSEEFVCTGRSVSAQRRKLERFLSLHRNYSCVLLSVNREIQEWFAARAIPALVLGSCHTGVRLPSLDVDYRAVCRHASGMLRSQGHRRIALIVADTGAAGDLASEEGFREGASSRSGSAEVEATVIRHHGTSAHIGTRLDALFGQSRPPTALVVAGPVHVFSVVFHLLSRGIAIPKEVSIVARDQDPVYEGTIAHYAFDAGTFARSLSRLMLQLVGPGQLAPEPNLIFPRYVPLPSVVPHHPRP